MKHVLWITAAVISLNFTPAYAADDTDPAVTQGAQKYDWQGCVGTKKGDCLNDCQTSEDINCANNCDALARDKCQSEGLSPP